MKRNIQFAALAFVLASTSASEAVALCPNCLGQASGFGPTLRLLGTFLAVPFIVFAIALRLIRRACQPPTFPSDPNARASAASESKHPEGAA